MPNPTGPSREAERDALDAAIADLILQATKSEWGDSPALLAAEGRLRAAIRKAASEMGEECVVLGVSSDPVVYLPAQQFRPGVRVRVVRVEERVPDRP